MNERTLVEELRKLINKELIWLRHYYAQVVDINDPLKKGRIKVTCFDLGFDTAGNGLWVSPRDKNSLTTLKLGDWTEIYFMGGHREQGVSLGKATEMDNMLPKNYKRAPTSHVIFEDPDNKFPFTFDSSQNIAEIGKTDKQFVARIGDETQSTSAEDTAFWTYFNTLMSVITGAPIPEPGNGAPSAFQSTLALALAPLGGTPSKIVGKITEGSDQVKVGKK